MKPLFAFALILFAVAPVQSQLVSEEIHSIADGPETICGITADAAEEFAAKVKADRRFEFEFATDRFITYATADSLTQWAFSKPGNSAHPMATCRLTYQGPDGAWYIKRQMRCDDSRENCDKAFLEFNELDERVKQELGG
jgi:hypothetical protein